MLALYFGEVQVASDSFLVHLYVGLCGELTAQLSKSRAILARLNAVEKIYFFFGTIYCHGLFF